MRSLLVVSSKPLRTTQASPVNIPPSAQQTAATEASVIASFDRTMSITRSSVVALARITQALELQSPAYGRESHRYPQNPPTLHWCRPDFDMLFVDYELPDDVSECPVFMSPVDAGDKVIVRNNSLRGWSSGFEVADVHLEGYLLKRPSDGCTLPFLFPIDDVRAERRKDPRRRAQGSYLDRDPSCP
jgi:hypothetical protein